MSRPFSVIFSIWLRSINLEFSAEAVWIDSADAVTDTCSVSAPSTNLIFPRSRTSLAVTETLDWV